MRPMNKYRLVFGENHIEISTDVTMAIREGWWLWGSPVFVPANETDRSCWAQAMVLPGDPNAVPEGPSQS